ncbi:transposase [Comamonas sp. EJ-4]|nr:transposase [Comamonas suwonensis]
MRGLLAERGITVNRSPAAFKKSFPEILEQTQGELTIRCQTLLRIALNGFHAIEAQIAQTEEWLEAFMKQPALCQKIAAIPGIGVMTATAMVAAIGDAKTFKNGRHLAAWI